MSRIRVLLIAEGANPEWTSVPLEGWSHAQAIAKYTDAHLVTQVRNRDAIVRAGLIEHEQFTAIDSEAVASRIHRLGSWLRGGKGKGWTTVMALSSISYIYFEWLVWKKFGKQIASGHYDIVHRLTPLSPTVPSFLARRCRRAGVPFVWGPINGGAPWPAEFDLTRRKEKEWLSYVRGAYRMVPGYRSTRRHSAAIFISSRHTWEQMPKRYHDRCFYLPENAIDPARFNQKKTTPATRPLRAIFVGRLVPYKGIDMLIESAEPLIRRGELQIQIIGDGPQRDELVALAQRLGVEEGVCFRGKLDHTQVSQCLMEADVFVFPSIREFGGAVIVEAMAVGVVPIVVNYAGPAELVTDETGYLIELGPRDAIIERFRDTLSQIIADPSVLESKSREGLRRAHEVFTWDAKAKQVLEVYAWLLDKRTQRPQFAAPWSDFS